ncbi:hypothetical protein C7B65_25225 [Phormidesmis priestleyi ULC007]|uniref:SD-repeat containing protein B domain-containing protein n=1 Tax=Phormidesmis priestleyi ULC007 TaxID=1920490 RepID=A0A2T1D3W2_9CYAN|nr:SdrD B-like domain-containing protein [Phormidesmis priestleyi]PSB15104.1 hypothetical protein C7B65_25225 [Phormidesmis priestleyi ULC007]PZO45990.1 MAG: hypothetical protein DCF14_24075 [Phormidesmis priestleyi]
MPSGAIPVKVTLKNEAGKEITSAIINAPGSHKFYNLPAGKYTVTFTAPDGFKFLSPNPSSHSLTGDKNTLEVTIGLKDVIATGTPSQGAESSKPPIGLIALAAISMSLLGNLSLVEDFFSSFSPTKRLQPDRVQSSPDPRPRSTDNRYVDELPPEVEAKLRQCLKENLKRLLGIPSLSDLVESLTKEENSKTEFQSQVILLYKRVKELRSTIEDCDPTLIQEIVAAENRRTNQRQSQNRVMIVGELVNVRVSPSLEAEVIEQLPYGTTVQTDIQIFTYLSDQQRLAIARSEGWHPIILSDRKRGYIYSLYIRKSL